MSCRPRWGRRCGVALTVLFLALGLSVAAAPSAFAHAALISTDPADGAIVEAPPEQITLTYNEQITLTDDGVRLFDPDGQAAKLPARAVDSKILADLPADLSDGTYVLSWRLVSADSHPLSGAISFSIGVPSVNPVQVPDPADGGVVDGLYSAAQTLGYLGLALVLGLLIFRVLVARQTTDPPVISRVLGVAAAAAVIGYTCSVPLTYLRQQGLDIGQAFRRKTWAEPALEAPGWSLLMVLAALTTLTIARKQLNGSRAQQILLGVGALLVVTTVTLVGHTRTFQPAWLIIGSDLVHFLAAAVWFGGLVGLILYLATARRHSGEEALAGAVATLRRFSTMAGWTVAALVISGITMGVMILGAWDTLFSTGYGITLIIKSALVGLGVVLAGWNRFKLLPYLTKHPEAAARWRVLSRVVVAEAAILVAVLIVTGLLVSNSPVPATTAPTSAESSTSHDHTSHAPERSFQMDLGEGTIRGHITPGDIGENTLSFELLDSTGSAVDPLEIPTVRISLPAATLGPFTAEVSNTASPGGYTAQVRLPLAGEWKIEIAVRISSFSQPIVIVPLTVE